MSLSLPLDDDDDVIVKAFKNGDRDMVERLLPSIPRPAHNVMARFQFPARSSCLMRMVSLLHLAAYHGWKDIVATLVEVHGCSVSVKDEGDITLHCTMPLIKDNLR